MRTKPRSSSPARRRRPTIEGAICHRANDRIVRLSRSHRVELFAEPFLGSSVGLLGQLRTPSVVEGSRSQWFGRGYDVNTASYLFCSTMRLHHLETSHPGG
jgi:hypothetical protein